jgi:adenine-specific DNA-methyltransferase
MTPGPHLTRQLGLFDVRGAQRSHVAAPRRESGRVRYIGSKARIVEQIFDLIGPPREGEGFFVDAFSGTGVVGARASDLGWPVRINDHLWSAVVISAARLLGTDSVRFARLGGYQRAVARLNDLPAHRGFLWREYSPASLRIVGVERRYFTEENAGKLDAARAAIEEWTIEGWLSDSERLLLLADLLSAANSVANIAGTYGCFMSKWLDGALKPVVIAPRDLRSKPAVFEATNAEVDQVTVDEADVAYFDPPYTKRQYAAYYHILETIATGDAPEVTGITGLRPWQEKASDFCYKTRALSAITRLLKKTNAARIYLSYSSEGHVPRTDLEDELGKLGVTTFYEIGDIGRYRPNQSATENGSVVSEFLVELVKTPARQVIAA